LGIVGEAISAKLASTTQSQRTTALGFGNLRDDYNTWKGPLTEHSIREFITKREGLGWATGRELMTLEDVVKWIGVELQISTQAMNVAKESIVRSLVHGFEGYSQNGRAMVCHSDFI